MDNKGNKLGSIRKETENKSESMVSVYQLHSDTPGLVPQFSGKFTSARIWASQFMVEHFIELTYLNLMKSTTQVETLLGKSAFEIWAATFGVRIHIYHADNGIFAEQHFISAIEDSNQKITFCIVRSNHQNKIFERKIQTITLGVR